jgi:hypothetical protein
MKIKAILTIVISLLIGFVFGFLASGQLMKQEMRKRHSHSYNEMFLFRTFEVIDPSESQKDTLMPIIIGYAEKALIFKNQVSTKFDSLMYQMNRELKPFITEDQFQKLEDNVCRQKQRHER